MQGRLGWVGASLSVLLFACSSDSERQDPDGGGPDDASMSVDGGGNGEPPDAGAGEDAGADAGLGGAACGDTICSPGQRCDTIGSAPACVDNACDDLDCGDTERCEPHGGGGNVCVDVSCDVDIECPAGEYCDGTVCLPDECDEGLRTCAGDELLECASNGSSSTPQYTCGSSAYFDTQCSDADPNDVACTCEDDWDCPAYTECDVDGCTGTGIAPTCTLPAIPFEDVPPEVEIHWGGDTRASDNAHDGTAAQTPAPWSEFAHVVSTPVVANLDDDNGDGLVNELDFPEILFIAHNDDNPWGNGVTRAIRGGGPDKGADYFARCNSAKLWRVDAPSADTCTGTEPDGPSGSLVAVGDLDGDGIPEIVVPTDDNAIAILDNTGVEISKLTNAWTPNRDGETIAIANLDYQGYAELVMGRNVYVLGDDGSGGFAFTHKLTGVDAEGINDLGPMACPADIIPGAPGQEIVAGATLYRIPDTLPTCGSPPCAGALEVVWRARDIAGQDTQLTGEGFCATADVWGADPNSPPGPANPLDGLPEVILIDDGDLSILDGTTGTIIDDRGLGGGARGGAPNVDDFDGDGFMEVASALQDFYIVVDLQASTGSGGACPDWPTVIARVEQADGSHNPNPDRSPGGACVEDVDCDPAAVCNTQIERCVCLHNGWFRDSDDDSSRATSSSVFDFNGDGAAEVIYNDECEFRIYDGIDGDVLYGEISRSRTGIENPVVADVDNDGNAEVVAGSNTAQTNRCDDDPGGIPLGPNGIRVWGDPTDTWVSARRIWNQQSYHVTNVTEGGGIPIHAPESWGDFNGRVYNTYRSQPRAFGVAPDLVVTEVGVSSPDAECGELSKQIQIAFEIANEGDLRVGPGIAVTFEGRWNGLWEDLLDSGGQVLTHTLSTSLEPGKSLIASVAYDPDYNSRSELPEIVRVVVDEAERERECDEQNNRLAADVEAGEARADLSIDVGTATTDCPDGTVEVTVCNDGTAAASDVVLRWFAGDPSAGGTMLAEQTLAGPIKAGECVDLTPTIPIPPNRAIVIYGVVDPDDAIDECDEADGTDGADNPIGCNILL